VIQSHEELDVYQLAFKAAMRIFELSKSFPPEERYALTDQIRGSSRSVCGNIAEAWRKRRYEAAFVSKPCEMNKEEEHGWNHVEWLFHRASSTMPKQKRLKLRRGLRLQ
jgi:hypothetical protein